MSSETKQQSTAAEGRNGAQRRTEQGQLEKHTRGKNDAKAGQRKPCALGSWQEVASKEQGDKHRKDDQKASWDLQDQTRQNAKRTSKRRQDPERESGGPERTPA